MFDNMRRLHFRGPTNRGICVDADGAMLGPACVLVECSLGAHRPIDRRAAGFIQGVLLPDHGDPDWLFDQCGRIARALDEGQIALAQIYGLHIPIAELDDLGLAKLSRATDFIRAGFNPAEPRVPKGDPRGGEWTDGGDGGGSSGPSSNGPSDPSGDGAASGGSDDGGSGSTASPTPSDLGAGDSGSGGDGGGDSTGDGGGVPTPGRFADASDAPQPAPSTAPASSPSTAEPAIEYIIVEPQAQGSAPTIASSPAGDTGAPVAGTPAPLGSADLDFEIYRPADVPVAISAPTEPTPGTGSGSEGLPNSAQAGREIAPEAQPLGSTPQFPLERPPTERDINPILRRTATWLATALRVLGPLYFTNPRVRLVLAAMESIAWLVEWAPRVTTYLDGPKSLRDLQSAVDRPRRGTQVHHIVEAQRISQNPESNAKRFPDRIDSRENLVRIPYWKHVEISTWYSTPNDRMADLSPREYLRGKSWDEQYGYGIQILRKFGVLQ